MTGLEVGLYSVIAMLLLIYLGMHVPVVLALISFVGVWVIKGNVNIAISLLWLAAAKTVMNFLFGVIPLFVLMGLLTSAAGMGRDTYLVAHFFLRRVRGGLGMATVVANAIFAAITGVSIASATVFSRIAVPEMLRFDYNKRFAVGTVAGSSVLGMLIPPSILLIIYALIAEESVGDMFIAGVGPGLLLTVAYCVMILFMAYVFPSKVMNPAAVARLSDPLPDAGDDMSFGQVVAKLLPIVMLVIVVLGGIYAGLYTPTEAGAAGAFVAFLFALGRRALTPKRMWDILVETGHITATLLLLIIAASMYSRMLGISGLPTQLGNWINGLDASLALLLFIYVVIVLILGTIIDSVSIMLITVPLFLTVLAPFNVDLVWFGIVTIIAVEIGLLTPPLGLAVYVIKSTLQNEDFTLADIFIGAAPYAITMLIVLIITIVFPEISLYLVDLKKSLGK
jgi:C4-dicarboxylate transporter DctM subunit